MNAAVRWLREYFDAPASASFDLPMTEAIAYWRAKGLKITFDYRDMLGAEHAKAFTIAKMADLDMLSDVRASLDKALAEGTSYREWAKHITPMLQAKGWWGKQPMVDPLTGATIEAQLGSPARLETIFRTNVQGAYAAGEWQQIQATADELPFLMYSAIDDLRTRPAHRAWDNTILRLGDPWWATHYPPNGYNCRCSVIQLSQDDLDDMGMHVAAKAPPVTFHQWTNPRTGVTRKVADGLDPGWDTNQGANYLSDLAILQKEKIQAMPPDMAQAAAKGIQATQAEAQKAAVSAGVDVAPVIDQPIKLAAGAGKAALRTAQAAITKALHDKTPYLAKAIEKVQASKAAEAMDPVQVLAKAQSDAAKAKDSAHLAHWKQAAIAGKTPPAAAQAVFDNLPGEAQASILDDVAAKQAATKAAIEAEAAAKAEAVAQAEAAAKAEAAKKAAAKAVDDELAKIDAGGKGPVVKANLEAVKAETPDIAPADLLAKVQAMPSELTAGQKAGGLAGWKKNMIAGKPPTAKQQLAFDTLDDAHKATATAQVAAGKAVQADAVADVKAGVAADAKAGATNLTKAQVATANAATDVDVAMDALEQKIADHLADQDPDDIAMVKAYLLKIAKKGSIEPGPDAAATFHALTNGTKDDLLAATSTLIEANKAADAADKALFEAKLIADAEPAPVPIPEVDVITPPAAPAGPGVALHPDKLTKIGEATGTNPGGLFVDDTTGIKWYVKFYADEGMAKNEVLANQLYEAAGVSVPDSRLITIDGRVAVANRYRDGLKQTNGTDLYAHGAGDDFVVDAWLGNWDVVGTGFDNMQLDGGTVFRTDNGGALLYRAQGGLKGTAFGNKVNDLASMTNPGTNSYAADVFGKVTHAQELAGAAKVLAIDDATIRALVREYGPGTATERKALARKLIARKKDIAAKFPEAAGAAKQRRAPKTVAARESVTKATVDEIRDARVNGVSIITDGAAIEDHNVITSFIIDAKGKPITRMFMKLTPTGDAAIMPRIRSSAGHAIRLNNLRETMNAAVRAINHRFDVHQLPNDRLMKHVGAFNAAVANTRTMLGEIADPQATALLQRLDAVQKTINNGYRALAKGDVSGRIPQIDIEKNFANFTLASKSKATTGIAWTQKESLTYATGDTRAGHLTLTAKRSKLGVAQNTYTGRTKDGAHITYVPVDNDNGLALQGMLMIDVSGSGADAIARAQALMRDMQIDTTPTTKIQSAELYADRIAYVRGMHDDAFRNRYAQLGSISDADARVNRKVELISESAGFDVTKSKYWNPDGETPSFGHGRRYFNRPDLDPKAMAKFDRDYVMYHNTATLGMYDMLQWPSIQKVLEGGGQLTSLVDRIRRGLARSEHAADTDYLQGGASQVFTRIVKRGGPKRTGLYWRAGPVMRRTDAVSYAGDNYGDSRIDVQRAKRKTEIRDWERHAAYYSHDTYQSSGNETFVKESLSIFDVERIVLLNRAEYDAAMKWLPAHGYKDWPDGRPINQVFTYVGAR